MIEQERYSVIAHTKEYALCKVISSRSCNYDKYVVIKCTIKRIDYWEPISNYYNDRYPAEAIYRRLIDGSKNL